MAANPSFRAAKCRGKPVEGPPHPQRCLEVFFGLIPGQGTRTRRTSEPVKRRNLLGLDGVSAEEITTVLDTAESLKEISARPIKKVPTLRGKTIVHFFLRGLHPHPHLL